MNGVYVLTFMTLVRFVIPFALLLLVGSLLGNRQGARQ